MIQTLTKPTNMQLSLPTSYGALQAIESKAVAKIKHLPVSHNNMDDTLRQLSTAISMQNEETRDQTRRTKNDPQRIVNGRKQKQKC